MSTPEERRKTVQDMREKLDAQTEAHLKFLRQQVETVVAEMDKMKGPLDVLLPLVELQFHNTDVENPHALRLLHKALDALLANIQTTLFGVKQGEAAFDMLKQSEDYEKMVKEMKDVCGFDFSLLFDKVAQIRTKMEAEAERFTRYKALLPEIVQ